jgi:hypothetical protein
MLSHFDDLLCSTPNEGAAAPIGISNPTAQAEVDLLMEAWVRERQDCIEYSLCLDRAKKLLRRILDDGVVTEKNRREAQHLLSAIKVISKSWQRGGV